MDEVRNIIAQTRPLCAILPLLRAVVEIGRIGALILRVLEEQDHGYRQCGEDGETKASAKTEG